MARKSQPTRSEIARRMLEGQRQVLRVQRRLFDNTYQALSALQNQQQAMVDRFVDSSRVPDEARDLVDTWREAAAAQRGEFRHAVDQSFESFDHLLERLANSTSGDAPATPPAARTSKTGARKKTAAKATKKAAAKKPTSRKKAAAKKATKKKTTKKKTSRSKKKR